MDRSFKTVAAVTCLVIGLFLGTNVMVSKESDSSWLMWAFVFLAGAVLFWLWIMKEERSAEDVAEEAAESARDHLDRLDSAARRIEIKAAAEPQAKSAPPPPPPAPAAEEKPVAAAAPSSEPDDLTRIEGIGPKFAEILQAAGITTYKQLADMSADQIVDVIRNGGGRKAASMETWAEQAKFAAKGDWDGLAKLQEKLAGGRRQ